VENLLPARITIVGFDTVSGQQAVHIGPAFDRYILGLLQDFGAD